MTMCGAVCAQTVALFHDYNVYTPLVTHPYPLSADARESQTILTRVAVHSPTRIAPCAW